MGKKKFIQGRYSPKNPQKYKGDISNIIYRSSWERKFLKFCDTNEKVLEYASEEFCLPYRSPVDGKIHRYFPDFYIKVKEDTGEIKKYIVEIKPKKQTVEPKVQSRKTKSYIYEVMEYAKNQAKWEAAKKFCKDRNYEFKIITEDELRI